MSTHFRGTKEEERALDLLVKLTRAAEVVNARINEHLAQADLTVSQFGVMEAVYHLGPLCQKDLAKKILKSSGNISFVIDNLVKRELVERRRSAWDRRFVEIHLTGQGRQLIDDIFPRHVTIVTDEMAFLTAGEQETLAGLSRKLGLRTTTY
jgi:MarR family 2-MHQ and catechol resistance regulon transcriptional repressor